MAKSEQPLGTIWNFGFAHVRKTHSLWRRLRRLRKKQRLLRNWSVHKLVVEAWSADEADRSDKERNIRKIEAGKTYNPRGDTRGRIDGAFARCPTPGLAVGNAGSDGRGSATSPWLDLREWLYNYPGGLVWAVQLWGSAHQSVDETSVRFKYTHEPIKPSVRNEPGYDELVKREKRKAVEHNGIFFNGPCARLLNFHVSPRDGSGVASEKPVMSLHLGPVGWYEYTFLRERYEKAGEIKDLGSKSAEMIDLAGLLQKGRASGSRTSNILDTATTLLTIDGYVAYQSRSSRVSASPFDLTSSVAENINRWKDECSYAHPERLVDLTRWYSSAMEADSNYPPEGFPNPFWTVRRGINDELAIGLHEHVLPGGLRLTGISFDLRAGHPDLLFVAFMDLTSEQIQRAYKERKGAEADEGRLRFVRPNFEDDELQAILAEQNWAAGGKASLVRAVQYLDAIRTIDKSDYSQAVMSATSGRI